MVTTGDDALGSARALRRCILDDERRGRIGTEYRVELLQLRADLDRILGRHGREPCGRCGQPLGDGERGWHAHCPE